MTRVVDTFDMFGAETCGEDHIDALISGWVGEGIPLLVKILHYPLMLKLAHNTYLALNILGLTQEVLNIIQVRAKILFHENRKRAEITSNYT